MKERALDYEHLVRRAFKCGRYGVSGANADVFRSLERNFVLNKNNVDSSKTEEMLFKYSFSCGEVATYIKTAVEKFGKDYEDQFTPEENQEIEDLISLLNRAKMEQIEEVIDRAQKLMITYGLYPG